ncbi:MAG: glycosyltransferase family 39 protein [Deltaproteobacteria bacterium]|nr:glycosyltransferase family 39 protein [Deltaproteobacteria bacterium]
MSHVKGAVVSPPCSQVGHVRSLLLPAISLGFLWLGVILIVNPLGEFMVNDDWSFVRMLEALVNDRAFIATGWGKGGPSAIVHILWGGAFTFVTGYSLTMLRVSVLFLGVLSSFALLELLRRLGASPWTAFLGAVTLVANPLFLSQCFTFMTDITFVCAAILAIFFIHKGMENGSLLALSIGFVFSLATILTRQIGIVIPLSFCALCLAHPRAKELGRLRLILPAIGISLVPWPLYEWFLHSIGSTPVTEHEVFRNILGRPLEKGFPDYAVFIYTQLVHVGLGYTAFLISPLLACRYWTYFKTKAAFRWYFGLLTGALVLVEVGLLLGLFTLPVQLYRNVIIDFGIGPILLKDTYLHGIQRTTPLSAPVFYFMVYWAALAVGTLLALGISSFRSMVRMTHSAFEEVPFAPALCLLTAGMYLGIITFTDFHDRYLIPVCAFLIVWLVGTQFSDKADRPGTAMIPGLVTLVAFAAASPLLVHDFMEMKRTLTLAQQYVVRELKADPCGIDGGFEFNGYHCYEKNFQRIDGLSWWWVRREDYLLTLGELPGYRVVGVFPFQRYVGRSGAVYVLQPEARAGSRELTPRLTGWGPEPFQGSRRGDREDHRLVVSHHGGG